MRITTDRPLDGRRRFRGRLEGLVEGKIQLTTETGDTLELLDLGMGVFITGNSRTQQPGTIFQQTPPAGTLAAPGTRITGWVVRLRQ